MFDAVLEHLTADDDPQLWIAALDYILMEVETQPDTLVEIGCCSHWIRPHQSRWTADGGFAYPAGYNPTVTGYSFRALPQYDWSVVVEWTGEVWLPVKRKSVQSSVRIAIPARTKRHLQAAIHSQWMTGKEKERRFYGFRKVNDEWKCTAVSD